tara:strand:- start:267 stop:986 length:720 start_codon:yes stop_codon:yes gene_type:complete
MIDLSNVTCFAIDNTNRIDNTIRALHTCMDAALFGEVKLVTTSEYVEKYKDELISDNILVEEQVRPLTNIDEYNEYILYHLYKHIDTDYCLTIQDHAFIINPDAWMDEFLEYDYIGAPWPWSANAFITPFGEHIRVGNGAFSLRSKKLLEVPTKVDIPFKVSEQEDFYKMFGSDNTNEDGNICVHNRHIFQEHGCKFAPLDIAKYFSYETPLSENSNIVPFGFHHHLPRGIIVEGYTSR